VLIIVSLIGLLGWLLYALSSTLVVLGVSHWLSTENSKSAKTVEKPVDNRAACSVCGAHSFVDLRE
jgi:predicted tellurium resistance membrane protein TerC